LLAHYEGYWLPAEAPEGTNIPAEDFFAPLLLNHRDGLCDTLCEDPELPGLPPECYCTRQLGVEARLAAEDEPQLVLTGSWGSIPGQPSGHLTVMLARAFEECMDPEHHPYYFSFLFVSES
jgi:hypothetical protein